MAAAELGWEKLGEENVTELLVGELNDGDEKVTWALAALADKVRKMTTEAIFFDISFPFEVEP